MLPNTVCIRLNGFIRLFRIVYYAALYAIVWYDWLVLLTKEYRKIWRADWSLLKFFYLANRYSTLALTIVVWAGEVSSIDL